MVSIFIIIFVGLSWIVLRRIWLATRKSRYRFVPIIAFAIFTQVLFFDYWLTKAYAAFTCPSDLGTRVHSKVKLRSLYLSEPIFSGCDAKCYELLIISKLDFVEVNVRFPSVSSFSTRPGIHRYYISEIGDLNCSLFNNQKQKSTNEKFWGLSKNACLAVEFVRSPKSEFGFEVKRGKFNKYAVINGYYFNYSIFSNKNYKILINTKSYYFYKGFIITNLLGFPGVINCRPIKQDHEPINQTLRKVLEL